MKENIPDEIVRAYVRGKLAGPELEIFEKLFDSDTALARAVALCHTEMAASELLIAADTRRLFEAWRQENPSRRPLQSRWPLLWPAGIAAGLLLVAASILVFRDPPDTTAVAPTIPQTTVHTPVPAPDTLEKRPEQNTPPQKTAINYVSLAMQRLPDPNVFGFRRSVADSTASVFRQAELAYTAGNFQRTLDLLAQTDSTRQQSAAFLSAHALFRLRRFDEAEAQFARLINMNSKQFRYQSEWGLLMCRLAAFPRREKEVRQQLNELLAQPQHPYFEQAKTLQKALKE